MSIYRETLTWAYVNLEAAHPVCTWDYYEEALKQFPDDIPVVVFSDVIDWCKEQEFFKPDRFVMSETTDEFADGQRVPWTDLCLMSLCTDAIIANSSFSWWGAWLINNPDRQAFGKSEFHSLASPRPVTAKVDAVTGEAINPDRTLRPLLDAQAILQNSEVEIKEKLKKMTV